MQLLAQMNTLQRFRATDMGWKFCYTLLYWSVVLECCDGVLHWSVALECCTGVLHWSVVMQYFIAVMHFVSCIEKLRSASSALKQIQLL